MIVAPKSRSRASDLQTLRDTPADSSQKSVGSRSARVGRRREVSEKLATDVILLRAVDRRFCGPYFDDDDTSGLAALTVWVDPDVLARHHLFGLEFVSVCLVQPGSLETPLDPEQQQRIAEATSSEAGTPSTRIIARLETWSAAPDAKHVALSPALSRALEADFIIGGLARLDPPGRQMPQVSIKQIKVYPFADMDSVDKNLVIRGSRRGHSQSFSDSTHGQTLQDIWDGPLTDGMVILNNSSRKVSTSGASGFLIRLITDRKDTSMTAPLWCIGEEAASKMRMQQNIASPLGLTKPKKPLVDPLPLEGPSLIGVENLSSSISQNLTAHNSVLVTGGRGAGKSILASLIACHFRSDQLFHIEYLSCNTLTNEENRVASIKDVLTRIFTYASWGAKLGRSSMIILDDLDKLCPVETELQTTDNGRSRHVSEILYSLARQYCGFGRNIVLLATAQSKENVNNVVIGSNIFKDVVTLKAPDKAVRRQMLQALSVQPPATPQLSNADISDNIDEEPHMAESAGNASPSPLNPSPIDVLVVESNLDFLSIAHQTDGYMPADLQLLTARAKNEAVIRALKAQTDTSPKLTLATADFNNAIENFVPASLRSIPLRSSNTTFASIGGLHSTRQILLETLQYPTLYAPLFAQCPLRLRSGLLLYGYPGCGKTMLASAIAGECDLNFISVKGPEVLNKYIGASEQSVRDLFERAEAAKPCVLFFDEFDSIAPRRGHDSTGVTDRVVNQLLTQMDGAEGLTGVYVLAATSRPDLIDPALLRPGRLDKSLLCDMPTELDRLDILRTVASKLHLSPTVSQDSKSKGALGRNTEMLGSLGELARLTPGYSGADLQAVLYNAQLEAIHSILHGNGKDSDLESVQQRSSAGPTTERRQEIVAFDITSPTDPNGVCTSNSQIVSNRKQEKALPVPIELSLKDRAVINAKLDAIAFSSSSGTPVLKSQKRIPQPLPSRSRSSSPQSSPRSSSPSSSDDSDTQRTSNTLPQNSKRTKTKPPSKDRSGTGSSSSKTVIEWHHILTAFQSTRPSISLAERTRLGRIYDEFLNGKREAEMATGEGSREVGGRSSLM